MTRVTHLVLHHSASPRSTTARQIRRWHLERGFREIGYHYVIEEDGRIVTGRPLPETGAHARGFNRTAIGVCAVGDNTRRGQRWNRAQRASLRKIVGAVRLLWPRVDVVGHRDLGETLCPGLEVRDLLLA